jgi:hypothetical protein
MILHDVDAEKPFEAAIDACFPYEDAAASTLIRRGWAISLNAAFCVLDELCRPPRSRAVSRERQRKLVAEWAAGPDHPLKAVVLRAANALIDNDPLNWQEGVRLMRHVGTFDGQRAALVIVYSACDCDSAEGDAAVNEVDREIRRRWDVADI